MEPKTKLCVACFGTGNVLGPGSGCDYCGGKGRVPDDEPKKKSTTTTKRSKKKWRPKKAKKRGK